MHVDNWNVVEFFNIIIRLDNVQGILHGDISFCIGIAKGSTFYMLSHWNITQMLHIQQNKWWRNNNGLPELHLSLLNV